MDQTELDEKERTITILYRDFLEQVQEAFNRHCDEIKANATKKFNAIPESDQEGRKKVLAGQKTELDKTLSELKQLLSTKGAEIRSQLEDIANLRDRQGFNLDEALKEAEGEKEKAKAA